MKIALVFQALSVAFSPIVCGAESHDHVERFVQVREVQNTPTVLEQEKPMSTWSFPLLTTFLNLLPFLGNPCVHPRSFEPPRHLESN
jgi:hypothetical protein